MQRTVNPARPRLACLNSSPVATAALVPAALLVSPFRRAYARRWLMHLSPDVQNPREWTEQEDSKLHDLVEKYRGSSSWSYDSSSVPWSKVAKMFPGRTAAWSKVPSEFRVQPRGYSSSQKQPLACLLRASL